jgi:hypothetical protein
MAIQHYYDPNVPNAVYLFDFGGAHGRQVYSKTIDMVKDITSILGRLKLLTNEEGYFLYGMTNSGQTAQRKMLGEMGFKSTPIGNLVQHSITHVEFAKSAKNAIEVEKKEQARLEAEKKKAEEERVARDIIEGRTPGEIRVGDVILYRDHTPEQNKTHRYVCVGVGKSSVQYASISNFSYYTVEHLARNCASLPTNKWFRAPSEVEAEALKRYPILTEFHKKKGEEVAAKAG